MPLATGTTLAHYRLAGKIGVGAMGEVWRARDTKLERDVAIKVLPEHFATDGERRMRFEREAKALATLNHGNVAQIFSFDRVDDVWFLVLELVPGQSLEEMLQRGPLPVDEALDVCRQIAEGVEAAHEAGVIHRDLKPANVRVTPEGRVKVLDFGLAKPVHEHEPATDTVMRTEAGRLLGTPTYMAPEQARGRQIDKRVDVWAFGCVLYECLTGKRAFRGETLMDVLNAVLSGAHDVSKLPDGMPRAVRVLLDRCLLKDVRQRVRDLGEARQILEHARDPGTAEVDVPPQQARSRIRPWLALAWGASLAVAFVSARMLSGGEAPATPAVVRSHVRLPADYLMSPEDGSLALSPDGRTLLLELSQKDRPPQLYTRSLDSLEPQLVGAGYGDGHLYPFWSPDGRTIAFFADDKLKRIAAAGGNVSVVCDAEHARGGTWTSRDEIIFAPRAFGPLYRVPAAGGVPVAVTKAEGRVSHRLPHALPDGRRILFSQENSEQNGIWLLDLDTGDVTHLLSDRSDAQFVPPGDLLFVRDGNWMAHPFDFETGKLVGQPRLLAERVTFIDPRLAGPYSASREGTLAYMPVAETHLQWVDGEGRPQNDFGPSGAFQRAYPAPDGKNVLGVVRSAGGKLEAWLVDARTGVLQKLDVPQIEPECCWAPDSRSFAYNRTVDGESMVFVHSLDGAGSPDRRCWPGIPWEWSRDGELIAFSRQVPGTGFDVYVARADGTGTPQAVAATGAWESGGSFSPDGRWLTFLSAQSGQSEVCIAPLARPGAIRPITAIGADDQPRWLDDGRIAFVANSLKLHEIPVTVTENGAECGEPRPAFGGRNAMPLGAYGIQTPTTFQRDGKRLLLIVPADAGGQELVLVQHWQAGAR